MEEVILRIFIFALGAIVGSFLNVCIVRLPHEKSIVRPGSHCVHCQKLIPWYDNIPLVSYWILRGRCRFCHKKISFRYFVVELTTAIIFLWFYLYFGKTMVLIPYFVLVSGLIAATFIDLEHRIIPDEISVGGMVVGLILSILFPHLHETSSWFVSLSRSFWGLLVGGGSIYLMGLLGDFLFKKESMGGGDVKLLAMIGSFLGWPMTLLAFFVAPFFGAIVGIVVKLRTRESLIAYGPFLSLGALVSLFWGKEILGWIFYHYGGGW